MMSLNNLREIRWALHSRRHMYTTLIVQYKKDKLRLQIVTGKLISKFESHIDGARRELTEELGVSFPIEVSLNPFINSLLNFSARY